MTLDTAEKSVVYDFIQKSTPYSINNNWRPHGRGLVRAVKFQEEENTRKTDRFLIPLSSTSGANLSFFFLVCVYRCLESCECAIRAFGTDTIPFPGSTYYNFRKTRSCIVMIKCFPKVTFMTSDFTFETLNSGIQ